MLKAANCDVEPAQVLCTMVMNIICASKPFYQVEEWVAEYIDGMAEAPVHARLYNDDRLGRMTDLLFKSDRGTMMTELASNAIRVHNLETESIRNDSTSITFAGAYKNNKNDETILLTQGFNKDHRPDCKQIVFGLNVTDDGYIPISYAIFDGNTTDDTTHVPNWEGLRKFLSREDFLYIADSKLCTADNLSSIDKSGGFFITLLPRNRKEVKEFCEYLEKNEVDWQFAYQDESSRKKDDFVIYKTYEGKLHHDGYRIVWVHSSAREKQDRNRREHKIEKIFNELADLEPKLNRYYLKTKEQIDNAIKKICKGSISLLNIEIVEEKEIERVQVGRGKPGPNTKYIEKERSFYRIVYSRNEEAIAKKTRTDGLFPLITNTELESREVLRKYKKQPYLEKRMNTTKSILEVAPVFLKLPRRIEALTFLYFISLMIVSLIERRIRKNLTKEKIEKLPILPQGMNTNKPTWANIKYFFRNVHLTLVEQRGKILQSTVKGMTDLHSMVAGLLEVPNQKCLNLHDGWWEFGVG
jgi:transposase